MGLVIDTSAVVDVERLSGEVGDMLSGIGDEPAALPAIVLAELLVGVRLARSRRIAALRRSRVDALRSRVPIVEFGADAADWWARLFVDLRRAGSSVPANDLAVASTAMTLGWGVLVGTRDEGHFRLVPGLRVRTLG